MATAECTITGMDAVFKKLDASYAQKGQKINAALQGAGILCQAEAKKHAPVGTPESTHKKGYMGGRLRSSIQYEAIPFRVTVRTNVNYAMFVEYGTHKMKARPFLVPAYELARQELMRELATI